MKLRYVTRIKKMPLLCLKSQLPRVNVSKKPYSAGLFPARRAIPIELMVLPVPGSEFTADRWFAVVNAAPGLSIHRPIEERTVMHLFSLTILPVSDEGDLGKIHVRNPNPVPPAAIRKPDYDMTKDIEAVFCNPGE
jgi:hypothetical protein